jgi:hypothetical protein
MASLESSVSDATICSVPLELEITILEGLFTLIYYVYCTGGTYDDQQSIIKWWSLHVYNTCHNLSMHAVLNILDCRYWAVHAGLCILGLEDWLGDEVANYLEKCTLTLSVVVKLFIGLGSGVPPIEKRFCSKFSANICKSVLGFFLQQWNSLACKMFWDQRPLCDYTLKLFTFVINSESR